MTALTMIFGMLPMMFATGVGANGSRSLASGAVGGMIVGTLALLFIVPVLFMVFQSLQERFFPVQPSCKDANWMIQGKMEDMKKRKKKES